MVAFKQYYLTEGFRSKITSAFLASLLYLTSSCGANNSDNLYKQISKHEGVKSQVYHDSLGKLTIGVGFNLEDSNNRKILNKLGINFDSIVKGKKLTPEEIRALYNVSIKQAIEDATYFLPTIKTYPDNVQRVIIDMAYNMGRTRLSQFVKFKQALLNHDYNKASQEMLNSVWAKQTKNRAIELANLIKQ